MRGCHNMEQVHISIKVTIKRRFRKQFSRRITQNILKLGHFVVEYKAFTEQESSLENEMCIIAHEE